MKTHRKNGKPRKNGRTACRGCGVAIVCTIYGWVTEDDYAKCFTDPKHKPQKHHDNCTQFQQKKAERKRIKESD